MGPGPVWTGRKSRPHRDSIPDRPARSQSLYRLSLILRVFDYIVTVSFGCILCCVCCNLLRNVCVCVCVGFVMCGCFANMCTC